MYSLLLWSGGGGGGVEEWRLKLTSAKVEVKVEAELGNNIATLGPNLQFQLELKTCLV